MEKRINFNDKKLWLYVAYIVLALLAISALTLFLVKTSQEFIGRLSYNLKEVYTADHSLYFAVGRGYLQGLKIYRDMYENKPPLIFLLSALSWLMTKSYYMLNIYCFISILIIAFLPTIYLIIYSIKHKTNPLVSLILGVGVLSISIILAMYGDARSGEAQIELFGASASVVAIFFLLLVSNKSKFYSPFIILNGFFFGIATMFKEPHGFLLFFLFLLFVSSKKDLFNRFLYPLMYGLITIVVILLFTNSFDTYFSIYLKTMLSNHIGNGGSPLERMFNINKLITNMKNYSKPLPILIIIIFIIDASIISYRLIRQEDIYHRVTYLLRALLLFSCIFLASFVVGVGGHYFNHHYIFALSFYVALLFFLIEEFPLKNTKLFSELKDDKYDIKNIAYIASALIFTISTFSYSYKVVNTNPEYKENVKNITRVEPMKALNEYVDDVCDALEIDRYLYIGFNGWHTYGYGEHLPLGPSFGQDEELFKDRDSYFVTTFLDNLHQTQLVIYYRNYTNVIKDEVTAYLNENFTIETPEVVKNIAIPENVNITDYMFYYRIATA